MELGQLYIFTILAFAPFACSLSTFDTNCTLPEQTYNYVQGPNTRGSLQIVWSCLATLIACTYTVLHMDVPLQRDGTDGDIEAYLWKGTRPNLVRANMVLMTPACPSQFEKCVVPEAAPNSIKRTLRWWWIENRDTLLLMVFTMIAPEWYAFKAYGDLLSARQFKAEFQKLPLDRHPPQGWTLTHAFFADMGGFAIRSDTLQRPRDITHLTARSLLYLLQQDIRFISTESIPNQQDIKDRSKSNLLTKSLVIFQVLWFISGCITRLVRGMSITQLEMSILGTAVCSLVSYAILFEKPHSVNVATVVYSFHGDVPSDIKPMIEEESRGRSPVSIRGDAKRLQQDGPAPPSSNPFDLMFFAALAIILGAFHIAAWSFDFPSAADKYIWRSAALLSTAVVPVIYLSLGCLVLLANFWPKLLDATPVLLICYGVGAPLYAISRLVLAVEMIRFLLYIPPGAFMTTWADNLPHV